MPKISSLPSAATPLDGTELVPIVQGGVTKQTAASNVTGSVQSVNGSTGAVTLDADDLTFTASGAGASGRAISTKLGEWISVKDFGATGDGSTNDTTAVNNALTAAAGKTLYFPAGTYLYQANSATNLSANTTLAGDGAASIIKLRWTGIATGTVNTFKYNGSGIVIRDLVFDGNKSGVGFSLVANTTFQHALFSNNGSTQRVGLVLQNLVLQNFPGPTLSSGNDLSPYKECLTWNVTPVRDLKILNVTQIDCDATFHIPGSIASGIDTDANWTLDVVINNFINRQSSATNGQWQGLGIYGAKRVSGSNIIVQGARYNGLNIEWCEDAAFSGVVAKDCLKAGVGFVGYVKNVTVDKPVIDSCGTAASTYTDTGAASVTSYNGSWYTGSISGNPITWVVDNPQIIQSGTTPVFKTANSSTTSNMGALETGARSTKLRISSAWAKQLALDAASYANGYQGVCIEFIDVNYGPFIPCDKAAASGTCTKANSSSDVYYTHSASSQYDGIYFRPGSTGLYAVKGKWQRGTQTYEAIMNSNGTAVGYTKLDKAHTDWVEFGFVGYASAKADFTFQNTFAGATSVKIKDLQIVCIDRLAGDVDFQSFENGTGASWGTAAPSSSSYSYYAGHRVIHPNPTPGSPVGWVCTSSGSAGTWKSLPLLEDDTAAAVSAAGTSSQAAATGLVYTPFTRVSTAAANSGVRLPTAVDRMVMTIRNDGANTVNVYPATGGQINALGSNTATTIAAGASARFFATSSTQWYTG